MVIIHMSTTFSDSESLAIASIWSPKDTEKLKYILDEMFIYYILR